MVELERKQLAIDFLEKELVIKIDEINQTESVKPYINSETFYIIRPSNR